MTRYKYILSTDISERFPPKVPTMHAFLVQNASKVHASLVHLIRNLPKVHTSLEHAGRPGPPITKRLTFNIRHRNNREREKSSTCERPARHPVSVIFFFPLQFGFRTGFVREYTTTLKKRRLPGQRLHWYTQDSQVRALRLSLLVCSLFVYRGTSLIRNCPPPQGPTEGS